MSLWAAWIWGSYLLSSTRSRPLIGYPGLGLDLGVGRCGPWISNRAAVTCYWYAYKDQSNLDPRDQIVRPKIADTPSAARIIKETPEN